MIKQKTKKIIKKILKIIWIIIGILLTIILISAYIKTKTFRGSGLSGIGGAIGVAIFFALALGIFSTYVVATLLFLLIRWLIKKFRKRGGRKK